MNKGLKKLINESFRRTITEKNAKYNKTRAIVESMVREAIANYIEESTKDSKSTQVRQALNDPAINKSGLARKIAGLSGNDDTRRSEISKIARGEWIPDTSIQNDILHTIASDTE